MQVKRPPKYFATIKKQGEETRNNLLLRQTPRATVKTVAASPARRKLCLLVSESGDKAEQVRRYRLAFAKINEVLAESEALYEDQREHALSQIVDAVKSTAKRNKNKGIRAPFEKSIRYTQQAAEKAVKTRKKNAAEKAARKPVAT